MTPNRIAHALRPARGYATLDLLAGAVENDLQIDSLLKSAVKGNCLQRYDRNWKPLPDPIPTQLLARALTESHWRGLISPCDKPWAYINTTTQHIYQRSYADETKSANPLEDAGLSPAQIDKLAQCVSAGMNSLLKAYLMFFGIVDVLQT